MNCGECLMNDVQIIALVNGKCPKCGADYTTVCGHQIQHDNSGRGHNWRDIGASDIPANIREEIEGEIIDGKKESCPLFVGSNGQCYRW